MAKHKRREQEPIRNETNSSNNNNNNPFGIDPGQLMGLLGGNFDINSMGNILASMNTNGFNLGSLAPLAKMAGINLGNNFPQGNNINSGMNGNMNYNMNGNSNINTDTPINSSPSEKANSNNHRKSSSRGSNNKNDRGYDENLNFLISLKSYVHPDRIKFIDKIIELYNSGIFEDI